MPIRRATFSPVGWSRVEDDRGALSQGAWEKQLRQSDRGDSVSLLHLDAGGSFALAGRAIDRALVLEGEAEINEGGQRPLRRGAYLDVSQTTSASLSSVAGCLTVLISGVELGEPAENVFSPAEWSNSGPGLWSRPLLHQRFEGDLSERVVGIAYFEPGSTAGRHPHPTAHLFLFLEGDAEDEMVYPDGTREVAPRSRGDFVEYDYPIDHQTFSKNGCMILFIHEPVSAARLQTR